MQLENVFASLPFEPKSIKQLRRVSQHSLANEDLWAFVAYRSYSIYLSAFLARVLPKHCHRSNDLDLTCDAVNRAPWQPLVRRICRPNPVQRRVSTRRR